jgi:5-methyltetrahydropteroyltriglutamate--homocysteine methyltransferase
LLQDFIDLNNRVLNHFTIEERKRISVHTCPGVDHDSTHSADVVYADLIPDLFKLDTTNFYMQLASEKTPSMCWASSNNTSSRGNVFMLE